MTRPVHRPARCAAKFRTGANVVVPQAFQLSNIATTAQQTTCRTTELAQLTSSAVISCSRSAPTAAAMSLKCATSASKTVACLYSADWVPA